MKDKKDDIAYYLSLFKIEGHRTWRAHLGNKKESFSRQEKNFAGKAKITQYKLIEIDRLTGELK